VTAFITPIIAFLFGGLQSAIGASLFWVRALRIGVQVVLTFAVFFALWWFNWLNLFTITAVVTLFYGAIEAASSYFTLLIHPVAPAVVVKAAAPVTAVPVVPRRQGLA
jgi:hypothetical protein